MAEKSADSKEKKSAGSGLDLSALSDLSFGPDWADSSKTSSRSNNASSERKGRPRPSKEGGYRDRRPDRGTRQGGEGAPRRDGSGQGVGGSRGRRDEPSRFASVERRGGRTPAMAPVPFKPIVEVDFYPQDEAFDALVLRLRANCRTYQLFEIAHLLLEKPERFVVLVRPLPSAEEKGMHYSVPDHLPFMSEAEAVDYVLANHLDRFFEVEAVEVDPPKGNFLMVNRCGVTGALLGPPNYHLYQSFLQQHFHTSIKGMSFERFVAKVETVKDEAAIAEWMDQMRKGQRYTVRVPENPAEVSAKAATKSTGEPDSEEPAPDAGVEDAVVEQAEISSPDPAIEGKQDNDAEVKPPLSFTTLEEAKAYLLGERRDEVVKSSPQVRFAGKDIAKLPDGPLRQSIEAVYEKQKHFPLDTANNIRGRLRRDKFTVYKKGAKGISYVCAVKRKFRGPETVFTESIDQLIRFVESKPMIKVKALAKELLGLDDIDTSERPEGVDAPEASTESAEREKVLNQLARDLRWLITEGYVSEFGDGSLFAQPMLPAAGGGKPKKENVNSADTEGTNPKPTAEAVPQQESENGGSEANAPEDISPEKGAGDDKVPTADKSPKSESEKLG